MLALYVPICNIVSNIATKFMRLVKNISRIHQAELNILTRALTRYKWNMSKTAAYLRLHRSTVLRMARKYGLERPPEAKAKAA